jgi:hypothetical protein
MTDPRIEGSLGDLNFRSSLRSAPSRREPSGNFWTGVAIFIGVALVYPFYSYKVQSQLLARELTVGMEALTGEVDAMEREAGRQAVAASNAYAAQSAAQAAAGRQRGVVVAGTTRVGRTRVVIVQLGQSGLSEAQPSICRQAAALFGERLSGERLRVQRHRGSQPALDVGTVVCD